jgi:hypothetical protein
MIKVFIATGYNSWTNKTITKAFLVPSEAEQFIDGLTAPSVNIFTANSYIDLLNTFLKGA